MAKTKHIIWFCSEEAGTNNKNLYGYRNSRVFQGARKDYYSEDLRNEEPF